jgi:hypothetical protein
MLQRVAQSGSTSALELEDPGLESLRPAIQRPHVSQLGSLTTYDLPPCPGGCDGMTAIMRSSDPGFFIFGSKIANPSRLEM